MKNKKILSLIIFAVIVFIVAGFAVGVMVAQHIANGVSKEITLQEAQKCVDQAILTLPNNVSSGAVYIVENTEIKVKDISYGQNKDVILECEYATKDVKKTVESGIDDYILSAYKFFEQNKLAGKKINATKVKQLVGESLKNDIENADIIEGNTVLYLYEVEKGKFQLYFSDEMINTVFGGLLDAVEIIDKTDKVVVNGEEISISQNNTLRTGIKDCIKLNNYSSKKPDTSIAIVKAINEIVAEFKLNFIDGARWEYLAKGLVTTLQITLCAVLIGIVIGFIVAIIRCTNQKTGKLKILSSICKLYLSVMRGTPVMVQLLIIYFVILLPMGVEKFLAAIICFGLNSGAYVSEIVRGGIMSIDEGQTEAGRSLGFNYIQTMYYIVIPQAFKAVLPSLANEFITLLKESSVAFYIGVADLTQGGLKIRSITYSNFMPLIAVAVIYLILVLGLSKCVAILERRLHKGDNRK